MAFFLSNGKRILAGLLLLVGARAAVRQARRVSFEGKTVLITGSSRGLGLMLAREFARRGARLVICARDEVDLKTARLELEGMGAPVLTVAVDLTDPEQVKRLAAAAEQRFGGVDVLVNNAGIIQVGPEEEMTRRDYESSLGVHFWAPADLIQAVLPGMRSRREGRIVNISSIGGVIAVPHLLPYTVGKFALSGLSEGLRAELQKEHIYVTTVIPGLMRTGSPRNALFKGRNDQEYLWFSVMDSLPLLSLNAERAARKIVDAAEVGQAQLTLGLPAKLGTRVHGLGPGTTAELLAVFNRLLPRPGGVGVAAVQGAESESAITRSWITTLSQRAARRHNQMEGQAASRTSQGR